MSMPIYDRHPSDQAKTGLDYHLIICQLTQPLLSNLSVEDEKWPIPKRRAVRFTWDHRRLPKPFRFSKKYKKMPIDQGKEEGILISALPKQNPRKKSSSSAPPEAPAPPESDLSSSRCQGSSIPP
mmetsp:Transcript_13473/g.24739  ORF Transcript_13473/g.24739 Transcript_13473/m.24739 type:complete len:125 (-) Transcript_13473:940-1314(-)